MWIQRFAALVSVLFGIVAMTLLLGTKPMSLSMKNRLTFFIGNGFVVFLNLVLLFMIPIEQQLKLFAIFVHLPIFVVFWLTTKISPIKIFFALFTAVFLIFPSNILLILMKYLMDLSGEMILISDIMAVIASFIFINRFIKPDFNYLITNFENKNIYKLCLLPFSYNIAIFWIGKYNYNIEMGKGNLMIRVLIFIITLTAYFLIFDIARASKKNQTLQDAQILLTLQIDGAKNQIETLSSIQEQTAIYRHDMRHHFALISGYLEENNTEKAMEYINNAQDNISKITPLRYCKNDTVNLILSSFATKAQKMRVRLTVDADLPQRLVISETELCALISNGLENAISAASNVAERSLREVFLSCRIYKNNLLILIKNHFVGHVQIENGLPQTTEKEHGFGVKSISMIADKYNGYCSFSVDGEMFISKIVLPLIEIN